MCREPHPTPPWLTGRHGLEKESHPSVMTKENIPSSMKYNCISMGINLPGLSKHTGRQSVYKVEQKTTR